MTAIVHRRDRKDRWKNHNKINIDEFKENFLVQLKEVFFFKNLCDLRVLCGWLIYYK